MEQFTFTETKTVDLADAHGAPIREGSVLREIGRNFSGVVTRVIRPGDKGCGPMNAVGDIVILDGPALERHTRRYSAFEHVPRDEQTYWQRYTSWKQGQRLHPEAWDDETERAIDGILALLPEDDVNFDYGSVDDLEDALNVLQRYLTMVHVDTKEDPTDED